MVFAEASYVVSRINAHMAMETGLLQMALSSVPNMSVKANATKKAAAELVKMLKAMKDGK